MSHIKNIISQSLLYLIVYMAQGDIGGAAEVRQENETPQAPKEVMASRQESKNSLDNASSLLQRELVWNQQTSTSLEYEIKNS